MSTSLWTLDLSPDVLCEGWVLPIVLQGFSCEQHLGVIHGSPCSVKVRVGWQNMILDKPTFEVYVETPTLCRGDSDRRIMLLAEALQSVLALVQGII